jgi:hypothetical protein
MKQASEPERGENRREAAKACGRNGARGWEPELDVDAPGDVVKRVRNPGRRLDVERHRAAMVAMEL